MGENGEVKDAPKPDPRTPKADLEEILYKIVTDGKIKELHKFLKKEADNPSLDVNCVNEEYDEDGGNAVIHCVKECRDKSGASFGKDYGACLKLLVEKGADVNAQDKAGRTALFWAVVHKYTNYVHKLLALGAKVDLYDQDGISPFHMAVAMGLKDCVHLFTQGDKQLPNLPNKKGEPPLITATKYGRFDICVLLLEQGADINAVEQATKRSAVCYAIKAKRLDILDLLLKHNPDLSTIDHEGKTILYLCCECTDLRIFHKVIHHCPHFPPDIMEQTAEDGTNAVIAACQKGNAEQLKHLLENGASVTVKDDNKKTALHHCADNLETQCAEMLLEKDSSFINEKDDQGYTAMALAVMAGNTNLLRLLLEKGADKDIADNEGHKLTHWAAVCGHLKVLQILIDNKADLSSADNHNAYPIHYAAQMNGSNSGSSDPKIAEKVLRKILECNVKMDVVDDAGRQPLLWAACSGNSESCKLLVKAGADVNSVDSEGLTALHCAASRGHHDCIEVLRKNGAECDMTDRNSCTALFYAITLGNKECTRVLLKAGADPNHVDDRGRNPAHCAAIKGCLDTIKLLEKEKADLWKQNKKGDYPIHEAAQKGNLDVVKYLLRQRNDKEAVDVQNEAGKSLLHISAAMNNLPLCKLLINHECNKNAVMKHSGREYTPYDLAVLKGYEDTANYLKAKGALPYSDLSNVAKRDSKSARSRKGSAFPSVEEDKEGEKQLKRRGSNTSEKGRVSPKKEIKPPTSPTPSQTKSVGDRKGSTASKKGVKVAVAGTAGTQSKSPDTKLISPSPSKKKVTPVVVPVKGRDSSQKSQDKTKVSPSETPTKESEQKSQDKTTVSPSETPIKESPPKPQEEIKAGTSETPGKESAEKTQKEIKTSPSGTPIKGSPDTGPKSTRSLEVPDAVVVAVPKVEESQKFEDTKIKTPDGSAEKDKQPKVDAAVGIDKTTVGVSTETGVKTDPEKSSQKKIKKQGSSDSIVSREDGIRSSKENIPELDTPIDSPSKNASTQKDPIIVQNGGTQTPPSMGSTPSKQGPKTENDQKDKPTEEQVIRKTHPQGPPKKPTRKGKVDFTRDNTLFSDDEEVNMNKPKGKRKHMHGSGNNMNKLIDSIRDSVKLYQNRRTQSRQLHQLKRAQIYTGPMHDILMFSKLMDTYRRGGGDTDDEDGDVRPQTSWEGYLQDQLKFVSHLYENSRPDLGSISEAAKKQHKRLAKEADLRRRNMESRCSDMRDKDERERQKKSDMDKEMERLAKKTAEMFDNVKTDADQTLTSAKTKNSILKGTVPKSKEQITSPREEPKSDHTVTIEGGKESRAKLKSSQKRRDEEMRRRLLQAYRPYFPEDVFHSKQVCISGNRVKSASRSSRLDLTPSPKPNKKKPSTTPSPRPQSHKSDSNFSVAQYKLREENTQVQMTPYGLRRVRTQERPTYEDTEDDLAEAIFFSRPDLRSPDTAANWSRKYDGNIRPRTGLVFVEPRVYSELIREEQEAKERISAEGAHQQHKVMKSYRNSATMQNGHIQNGVATEVSKS